MKLQSSNLEQIVQQDGRLQLAISEKQWSDGGVPHGVVFCTKPGSVWYSPYGVITSYGYCFTSYEGMYSTLEKYKDEKSDQDRHRGEAK